MLQAVVKEAAPLATEKHEIVIEAEPELIVSGVPMKSIALS